MKKLIFLFLLLKETYASCKIDVKIDISEGILHKNGTVLHNGTYYVKEHTVKQNGVTKGCVCEYKTCVRKCCLENKHYNVSLNCVDSNLTFMPKVHNGHEEIFIETFHIIETPDTNWCNGTLYRIEPEYDGEFKIQKDGDVFITEAGNYSSLQFCAEHFEDLNEVGILACEIQTPTSVAESIEQAMPTVG